MKKKITLICLLLSIGSILYSQEISEKEGKRVLEEIRREIQAEERAKQKAIEEEEKAKVTAEKIKLAAEKDEEKKGKKILEKIKREQNESLEEKVFRSENTPESRVAATSEALEIGKERMAFLKQEEEEIIDLEKVLGIEANENRILLGQKFDEVYDNFKSNNKNIELLLLENEKLKEYLIRLEEIEQKVKK